jgi:hypothetical protein
MSTDIEVADGFDRMNKVVELTLKGYSPSDIAKELEIKRAEVLRLVDEWKDYTKNDKSIQDRARESLVAADQHFSMLINKAWETVEQSDSVADLRSKVASIKLVSDIQSKQIEMLQKAGLLDNEEIGARIAESEEKQEILVGILRDVTSKCPTCRKEVASRLSRISGVVEPIHVIYVENA